jgi:hypothetical protein
MSLSSSVSNSSPKMMCETGIAVVMNDGTFVDSLAVSPCYARYKEEYG